MIQNLNPKTQFGYNYSISKDRQGEFFILLSTILWGLLPVITILSFSRIAPLALLAWGTLFSTIFFAVILTIRKKWKETKNLSALQYIFWVALIYGILYYVLFFAGLKYTSAGNASIIDLTAVFFSFLLFQVWWKDYISKEHIWGAILVLIASGIVLYPNLTEFRMGDMMILMANAIVPLGDFFQQRARERVSSETILFLRELIATPFLFLIAYLFSQPATILGLRESLLFILLNGVVLLGFSKIFWIEGIHRISITKVHALTSISPILTLLFAWLLLKNIPTTWQLFSIIPMICGVILLGINKKTASEEIKAI